MLLLDAFIRWWRGSSIEEELAPQSEYKHYEVEFYPQTVKYFVLYKNTYLKKHFMTGLVEEASRLLWADSFNTEEAAWRLVDLHREQYGKANVKVLRR